MPNAYPGAMLRPAPGYNEVVMRAFTATVFHWVHQIGLTLWLGGILIIGAVMAPSVFKEAKALGDTHAGMPLYDFASHVMNVAFGKFNGIVLASGVLMLIGGLGSGMLSQLCRKGTWLRAGITLGAWAVAGWLALSLYPAMMAAKAAGQADVFKSMHSTYNTGFMVELVCLLAVAGLTAWLEAGKRISQEAPAPRGVVAEPVTA
jgi:hypothetical protein